MEKSDLIKLLKTRKMWWISDFMTILNNNVNNKAMMTFRESLSDYGDYPDDSPCVNTILILLLDDIEELD